MGAHNEIPHMNREDGEESEVTRTVTASRRCVLSRGRCERRGGCGEKEQERRRRRRGEEDKGSGPGLFVVSTLCLDILKSLLRTGIPLSPAKRESLRVEGNSAAAPKSREGPCVAERAVKQIES